MSRRTSGRGRGYHADSKQAALAAEYARSVRPRFDTCYDGHDLTLPGSVTYQRTNTGIARTCRICHSARVRADYHAKKKLTPR